VSRRSARAPGGQDRDIRSTAAPTLPMRYSSQDPQAPAGRRPCSAAFIHDMAPGSLSNVAGNSNYVRLQVLTPAGVLDRDKQQGVVRELTEIIAAQARDATLAERTWVLITDSPDGGWGINRHANTGADIADARRELAGN
jgi:phenylpyruvate tautomerase PptA (4-oxalocrotonate tautomerase family)